MSHVNLKNNLVRFSRIQQVSSHSFFKGIVKQETSNLYFCIILQGDGGGGGGGSIGSKGCFDMDTPSAALREVVFRNSEHYLYYRLWMVSDSEANVIFKNTSAR